MKSFSTLFSENEKDLFPTIDNTHLDDSRTLRWNSNGHIVSDDYFNKTTFKETAKEVKNMITSQQSKDIPAINLITDKNTDAIETTPYMKKINSTLKINQNKNGYNVIDLFSGCGGLSLGFSSVGCNTTGYEANKNASATYNDNFGKDSCITGFITPDTRFPKNTDIIIGGPPCQPFSMTGSNKGNTDERDGFPAYISAVNQIKPKMFMFENVFNLSSKNHKEYFDSILKQLSDAGYTIQHKVFDTANYDVPQRRKRLICVGVRNDIAKKNGEYKFPEPQKEKVTVRQALGNIGKNPPLYNVESKRSINLTPEQLKRMYKFNTDRRCFNSATDLDDTIKTITCHNVTRSTNDTHRFKFDDGSERLLTLKEASRLQSFPDTFRFHGNSTTACANQIGNAVPPMFAHHLAKSMMEYLGEKK